MTSGMGEASTQASSKRICKKEPAPITGTRLQRKTICLTAAEWAKRNSEPGEDLQLQEHTGKFNIQRN